MEIIGTGLTGLVGSRVVEINTQHHFTDLSLDSGFDILKPETLENVFQENPAPVVIHFAAFTDTNAAFAQKGDESGLCYQLNVVGTRNIAYLCQKFNKHLIHISTDFILDGSKNTPYDETDEPKPRDWYGHTKYLAEIEASKVNATIVRIAYPYRAKFISKVDLIRKIKAKLENLEEVKMFSDQITTPTFIDDIAVGLAKIIDKKPGGIYHLVGSSSQSPYDMAKLIATTFNLNSSLIQPISLIEYLKTPGNRPYAVNGSLSNQKFVSEFGFTPKTLTEGLTELKQQLSLPPSPQN